MILYDNCPNCFMPLSGNTSCPSCGYDYTKDKQYFGVLPAFTVLNNKYLVGRVLGRGGFGITYKAKNLNNNTIYAIKEYMPTEYSGRSKGTLNIAPRPDEKSRYVFEHGRERFMLEARTLVKLHSNPNVVDIIDFFSQNNTAYLVMEYLDGQDLQKMARSSGGKLAPEKAEWIFLIVASALMEVHNLNILHRDLSPENIFVTKDNIVKLIDFGSARNYVRLSNKGMSVLLKPGFAPLEQYDSKGCQGPWSDVYALCATYYKLVSGKQIPDAYSIYAYHEKIPSLNSIGCQVSKKMSDIIDRGLALDYRHRYKNFKELLDDYIKKVPNGNPDNNLSGDNKFQKKSDIKTTNISSKPYIASIIDNKIGNKCYVTTNNPNDIFKIGRSNKSCQFVVDNEYISKIHCYLRVDKDKFYLTDVSSNGTFFENGTRLEKNKAYGITPGTKFYLSTRNYMVIFNVEK